jgi:hypothetical protein
MAITIGMSVVGLVRTFLFLLYKLTAVHQNIIFEESIELTLVRSIHQILSGHIMLFASQIVVNPCQWMQDKN